MKRAVINIGSNSVKLYIEPYSYDKKIIVTGLGKLSKSFTLERNAIDATVKAAVSHFELARKENCEQVYIFATEAVRKARNQNVLIDAIEKATNIKVDIVSGDDEARMGVYGALAGDPSDAFVMDLGGSSIQLSYISKRIIRAALSLPLGKHNLNAICQGDTHYLEALLPSLLSAFQSIKDKDSGISKLILIGGSGEQLSGLDLKETSYDERKFDNHILSIETLKSLIDIVKDPLQIDAYPYIKNNSNLIYALYAVIAMLEFLEKPCAICSVRNTLEGYLIFKDKSFLKY